MTEGVSLSQRPSKTYLDFDMRHIADRWKLNMIRKPTMKVAIVESKDLCLKKGLNASSYVGDSEDTKLYRRLDTLDRIKKIKEVVSKQQAELDRLKKLLEES